MNATVPAQYDIAEARLETPAATGRAPASLQRKVDASPRQLVQAGRLAQLKASAPAEQKPNGLPPPLRAGIEALSGVGMSDVVVHHNSAKPAQLNAYAYAQGSEIHLGPGQERHLPHEAWHVVQQKQGRVRPTRQAKGRVNLNDDASLEKEADVMGERASRYTGNTSLAASSKGASSVMTMQGKGVLADAGDGLSQGRGASDAHGAIGSLRPQGGEAVSVSSGRMPIQRRRVSDGKIICSVSSNDYPESVQHISDAITKGGQPSRVTINRPGAKSNRRNSLRGIPTISGTDRDEYPMAMFAEGGTGASVRHIDPSDNRGAGSSIGHGLRKEAPNGETIDVEIVPQTDGSTVIQL